MLKSAKSEVDTFMKRVEKQNPGELEFHQAVREVCESVIPFTLEHTEYREAKVLERLIEPDRVVIFRVAWEDDKGEIHVNRAWRVQFNNSIGPYKGGLRFHPSVNLSVLKFLGFEQVLKNSLTGLPMGGAKGGSNFDPKGKSDREVMRFCQSLMTGLFHHIGPNTDVPAGDIGVGVREISFMFGQYKRLSNQFTGVITGKGLSYGGSLIRTEATGYGCVYFCENMFNQVGDSIRDKIVAVSGSGNVAIYAVEKCIELGAKVVTLSDSSGFIHDPDGLDIEKLEYVKNLKEVVRGRIHEYAEKFPNASFHKSERPWRIPCDVALPCATQNEITGHESQMLLNNGLQAVSEGANMPTTLDGVHKFLDAKILYGPGKAANAGGVAVSGLEQSQNALRMSWTRWEVDEKLKKIMKDIHDKCYWAGRVNEDYTNDDNYSNYVKGANIAGFCKVGDAIVAQGVG
jgi:glutamate dehydrogenase (NADP+)